MDIYTFYVEIIIVFFEGFLYLYWYQAVYDRKGFLAKNKVKTLLFCLTYVVVSFYFTRYTPIGYHTFFILSFVVFLMSYITKKRILSLLIIVASNSLLIIAIEAIVLSCYMAATGTDLATFVSKYDLAKCVVATIAKLIQAAVTYLIERANLKLPFHMSDKTVNVSFSFFILQMFVFGIMLLNVNNAMINKKDTVTYSIVLFLLYLVFTFLGISDIIERSKLAVLQSKYQMQEQQIRDMGQMLNIIRKEKHDFINHLNTIQMISSLNEPDGLEQISRYIASVTDSLKASYRSFGTGNYYIDALLAIKSSCAEEAGIRFEVVVDASLDMVDCPDNELVSIISNLVDNAIEVVSQEGVNENSFVSLWIYSEAGKLFIEVADNGRPIPDEIKDKIFEPGFTTKAGKPDSGYGLYIVRQLVEKNGGKVFVKSDEELTKFIVELRIDIDRR